MFVINRNNNGSKEILDEDSKNIVRNIFNENVC